MKKAIIGVAAVAAAVAAVVFGPALVRRGMTRCEEMMTERRSAASGGPVLLRRQG